MSTRQRESALWHVQTLFEIGTTGSLTDGQLLEAFRNWAGDRREAAFAALVARHGPMVLRTCRAILRDEHAVEDSFQATFLILVRRASSLWIRDSLGPWLYQVACRVALSARSAAARRRRHEQNKAKVTRAVVHHPQCDDLGPLLHEELARLPLRYRAPIVLCCVEGQSHEQAAVLLGVPLGTLQSRLARGRRRLQTRLVRRGLAPPAALLSALLPAEAAPASVPAVLAFSTIQAAIRFGAARPLAGGAGSIAVATLTEGVLKTMFLHKLKLVSRAVIAAAITAAGVGVWAQQASRAAPRPAVMASFSAPRVPESPSPITAEATPGSEQAEDAVERDETSTSPPAQEGSVIKYGDGQPDGKKSLGGSGEMIEFSMPAGSTKVVGVRIHGSRYGYPQPPKEHFLIYFLSDDQTRILHTELAPYSLFERANEQWVDVAFDRPVEGLDHTKKFWVVLDFRAAQTKGVFVSFDTSTQGKHSRMGLPGIPSSAVNFGGDWMIEAKVAP